MNKWFSARALFQVSLNITPVKRGENDNLEILLLKITLTKSCVGGGSKPLTGGEDEKVGEGSDGEVRNSQVRGKA